MSDPERHDTMCGVPSESMQLALSCANYIMSQWLEWDCEAQQAAQIEQDSLAL